MRSSLALRGINFPLELGNNIFGGVLSLGEPWRGTRHLLEEVMELFQVLVCILCVFFDIWQLP